MRGFKSARHAQRFLSTFGMIADLFSVGRHMLSAVSYRAALSLRFVEWREVTGVSAAA
jgi:putative transposase